MNTHRGDRIRLAAATLGISAALATGGIGVASAETGDDSTGTSSEATQQEPNEPDEKSAEPDPEPEPEVAPEPEPTPEVGPTPDPAPEVAPEPETTPKVAPEPEPEIVPPTSEAPAPAAEPALEADEIKPATEDDEPSATPSAARTTAAQTSAAAVPTVPAIPTAAQVTAHIEALISALPKLPTVAIEPIASFSPFVATPPPAPAPAASPLLALLTLNGLTNSPLGGAPVAPASPAAAAQAWFTRRINFDLNQWLFNTAPTIDPPTVNEQTVDGIITGKINATDTNNDALKYTVTAQPTNGTVVVNNDGTFTYTPNEDFADAGGSDAFTVKVSDNTNSHFHLLDFRSFWIGADPHAKTSTVNLTVTPVNDAPVAADDATVTDEDTPAIIDVLANDTDEDGDELSVTLGSNASHGNAVVNGDGTITYTPNADFNGTDSFTYSVTDGEYTDTATVTITVTPVNDAPVANDDTATTDEGDPVVIGVLGNDTDVEDDPLTVTGISQGAHGTAAVNDDGTITYTPNAGFFGTDSFTYAVSDGVDTGTATVTVTVNKVNTAPVAVSDSFSTAEDTPLTIPVDTLTANDTDPHGDPLTVTAVSNATGGTVSLDDGVVTFTPDTDYDGPASFTYTISDGEFSSTAMVLVDVTPVNDAPVANPDYFATNDNTPLTIPLAALLDNDTDADGDALQFATMSRPRNGSLDIVNGEIVFTPDTNFVGEAGFEYSIYDGNGGHTSGNVIVNVVRHNDPPVAKNDIFTTAEDTPLELTVGQLTANDVEPDGDPLTVTVANPTNGTVSLDEGIVTFTPNANYYGPGTFDYTISDGEYSSTATVTVNVTPVNDAPVANPDYFTIDKNTSLSVTQAELLANDTDVEGNTLQITSVTGIRNGTFTTNGGFLVFTPNADFVGEAGYNYSIYDGTNFTIGQVIITVVEPNPIV